MSNATVREQVTKQIIAALESGDSLPWRKPWRTHPNAGRPASVSTGKPYRGINVPLLQIHAGTFGFSSKHWATYRQWESLGGQVMRRPDDVERGDWAATAVLFRPVTKTRLDDNGEEVEDSFYLLRTFRLFNADQVVGAEKFQVDEAALSSNAVPDFAPADELIASTEADIRHGGEQAFYHRLDDYIRVPQKHRFDPPGSYYETLLHELGHWSESRLGWDHEKEGYAMGELVAELSASMLSAELGVPQGETLENHAGYLKSWLTALENDHNFIFRASSQASKVADFLLSFVEKEAEKPEPATVV